MKTFWISGPSPFKSARSINAIIFGNVMAAQTHFDRPLTRPEIAGLIKRMKERTLIKSKQDNWALYNNFMTNMKHYKLVEQEKPGGTQPSA